MTRTAFRPTPQRTSLIALAAALALGTASTAYADDSAANSSSDIVVTAAGFEQKITDAPASITVVSGEELAKRPYITLIDAVRDVEGVDVGETSDKTGQRSISIRGMGSDYTLILIDGRRQNNHGDIYPNSFGGNQFNHIPPLDSIERIEVIRGPASTLYGADALGGVINIITKKVQDRWSGSLTASRGIQEESDFGDDMTFDANISGPLIENLLGVKFRGSFYKRYPSEPEIAPIMLEDGTEVPVSLGFGGGGRTVANTNRNYGGSLVLTPNSDHSIIFDIDYSKQKYDNSPFDVNGTPTFPLGTLDSIDTIWRASRNIVQPRVGYLEEQVFDRLNWALSHNGNWGNIRSFVSLAYISTNNKGRTMPFSVEERDALQSLWDQGRQTAGLTPTQIAEQTARLKNEAAAMFLPRPVRTLKSSQYTLDARVDIPIADFVGSHNFVVGGQFIDGKLDDGIFGLEAAAGGSPAVQDHRLWALFAEDNWSITDSFTLTGGIRYDNHNLFGGRLSPRLYANYEITPELTVKGGISTGYKTPKTTDLYDGIRGFGGQGVTPQAGNSTLQPETSRNSEIAIYWNPTSTSGVNVTLFHNKFKNKIDTLEVFACGATTGDRACANVGDFEKFVSSTTTYNIPFNIGSARIQGLEMAGRYAFTPTLSLRANYTLTDSEQLSGAEKGKPLTSTARHMANATLDWKITDQISTQLSSEYRSKRYRGSSLVEGLSDFYRAYHVVNFGAQYRINDHITLAGRVNNLLNRDFTDYEIYQNDSGTWSPHYDYNNKDKTRSYWVSMNARF